jgi:hypothetical protein
MQALLARTLVACTTHAIELSIAAGCDPHHSSWHQRYILLPDLLSEGANAQVTMADTRRTALGQTISRACTCLDEPVVGIITEVLGFYQFSLRGKAAAGEWCLICVASPISRTFVLSPGIGRNRGTLPDHSDNS